MGCLCSKSNEENVDNKSVISLDSQMSLGSRNWFCKSKEEPFRFFILADCIRAKHRSLGRNVKHNYRGENFKVDVKLLTNGNLEVSLHRSGEEVDMNLKVALIGSSSSPSLWWWWASPWGTWWWRPATHSLRVTTTPSLPGGLINGVIGECLV